MKIVLSGGGTGGHIYPALALMNRIKEKYPDSEFLYVGTDRGLESTIVPKAGVAFKSVKIQGLRRSLSLQNLKTVYLMIKSISDSKKIIKAFQPDVVIGTGGYVCAPVLYAASKLGVPTIIHEQNSVAGVTNKFLSRVVDRICICFEDARGDFSAYPEKIVFTGNPRAQEVASLKESADLKEYGLKEDVPTVLIFGGSRGARKLNDSFAAAYPLFKNKPYQVLLATGEVHYKTVEQEISALNDRLDNVRIVPYIHDMPKLFKRTDLIVSRSGATTLTEVMALGLPSILIPSPYVTNNHQQKNAESLVKNGAAEMILEQDLQAQSLFKAIDNLMSDETARKEMAFQAKQMGITDASDRIIEIILDLKK